jgi:transcriptional regulator with XRE-family HTH domain
VIKQRRIQQGLTQAELANKAGVTKNYVTMVERGARPAHWLVRVALAEALGLSVLEVLRPEEIPAYRLVDKALSLEGAEAIVWQLERCLESRAWRPTVSKITAMLALRTVVGAKPERKTDLQAVRNRLNELYRR